MKKTLILILALSAMLIWNNPVSATPYLQLDISNGTYIGGSEETVFSTTNPFTLYALINSDSQFYGPGETYYISAAISPQIDEGADLGSFSFAGTAVDVTDDMIFGTPPSEATSNSDDLSSHGIYDTYYKEFEFTLDPSEKATDYNSQDSPGGLVENPDGTLYFQDFFVDLTGLDSGYSVHFDLYTKNEDGSIKKNAPFSHDAQSGDPAVPEPATIILMVSGLLGLIGYRRKLKI